MVEEIITALSRIRWLFVIARNSSFTYKGQAVDVKQVGRELGVRYVLEGSVRKAGGRVRITAQLIDATTGAHLWADRSTARSKTFRAPGQGCDQASPASSSRHCKPPKPALAEPPDQRPDRLRPLSARLPMRLLVDEGPNLRALGLLERAIERDPHYGPALAWAAIAISGSLRRLDRRPGDEPPQGAPILLGGRSKWPVNDPDILANAAFALGYFGEDIGAMIGLVDRRSRSTRALPAVGISAAFSGNLPANPISRSSMSRPRCASARATGSVTLLVAIGVAYFFSRRFDEAVPKLLLAIKTIRASRPVSLSRRLLCPYGAARRSARDHRPVARHHPSRGAERLRFATPSTASSCCRACDLLRAEPT